MKHEINQTEVLSKELAQIEDRRKNAGIVVEPHYSSSSRKKDEKSNGNCPQIDSLIGVSLSGGGVRSGAMSLGFLMGLARHNLLRCVDYLSTVSGGGYAGAALSAEAERVIRNQALTGNSSPSDDTALFREGRDANEVDFHKTPQQLRKLHSNSNYLIKNRGWASRAAMGIVAMGTLIVSGVVCLASLIAYCFRALFAPEVYDYFHCLGFRGDIWVAMSPSCVLFLTWLFCWLMSFFDHKREAEGIRARYVFTAWIVVTVIGLTLIATTGDLDIGTLLTSAGISESTWSAFGEIGTWAKMAFVSAIGVSLLPYFRPGALLQSGREKAPGPKRILFTLARNGLLFGVPLLVFAFMARENISNWNELRDHRILPQDLVATTVQEGPTSRYRLFYECDMLLDDQHSPTTENALRPEIFGTSTGTDATVDVEDLIKKSQKEVAKYLLGTADMKQAQDAGDSAELVNCNDLKCELLSHEEAERQSQQHDAASFGNSIWGEQSYGSEPMQKSRLGRLSNFAQYLLAHVYRDPDDTPEGTAFGKMIEASQDSRAASARVVWRLNRMLLNPVLYKSLPLPDVDGELSGTKDQLSHFERIRTAVRNAKALETYITSTNENVPRQAAKSSTRKVEQILFEYGLSEFKEMPSDAQTLDAEQRAINLTVAETPSMTSLFLSPSVLDAEGMVKSVTEIEDEVKVKQKRQQAARALLAVNRELLSALFPGCIATRDTSAPVYNFVVLEKDQQKRFEVFGWSLLIFLVSAIAIDLNASSWHGFYAKQLSSFWVQAGLGNDEDVELHSLRTTKVGNPYHLINAAVWFPGQPEVGPDALIDENPDQFLLSSLYCGSEHTGVHYASTSDSAYKDLTLGDAIALSGAAVSPWSTRNSLVQVLLLVLNLRTGLWLPNPSNTRPGKARSLFDRIDAHFFPPMRWLALRLAPRIRNGAIRRRPAEEWSHLLVTDGGHYENLGIEALLVRRCRLIIAVDATEDPNYEFENLAAAISRLRVTHRMRFVMPGTNDPVEFPDKLVPEKVSGFSDARFLAIEVHYPGMGPNEHSKGLIILIKSAVTKDDPLDLVSYKKQNPEFPNHPTSDQFFDAQRFEAYRYLGRTAEADLVGKLFGKEPPGTRKSPKELADKAFEVFGVGKLETSRPSISDHTQEVIDEIDAGISKLKEAFTEKNHDRLYRTLLKLGSNLSKLDNPDVVLAPAHKLVTDRWDVAEKLPQLLIDISVKFLAGRNDIVHEALRSLASVVSLLGNTKVNHAHVREGISSVLQRINHGQPHCNNIRTLCLEIKRRLDAAPDARIEV